MKIGLDKHLGDGADKAVVETLKAVGLSLIGHVAGASVLGRYSFLTGLPVTAYGAYKDNDYVKYLGVGMVNANGFTRPAKEGVSGMGEMMDNDADNYGIDGLGNFSAEGLKKGIETRFKNHWSHFSRNIIPFDKKESKPAEKTTSGFGNVTEFENPFGKMNGLNAAEEVFEPSFLGRTTHLEPDNAMMGLGMAADGSIL